MPGRPYDSVQKAETQVLNRFFPIDKQSALRAMVLFFSLSIVGRCIVLTSLIAFMLGVFSLVVDAVCEVAQHLASAYASSDSLTRLLIFMIAALFVRKAFPYIVKLI
jgi:hypothetical protein